MDGSVHIPQRGDAEGNVFHSTAEPTDIDDITDAVLVFKDDEETGDDVTYQVLPSKADGDTEDTGTGQDGCDVYFKFLKYHHGGYQDNQRAEGPIEEAGDGAHAFDFGLGKTDAVGIGGGAGDTIHHSFGQHFQEPGNSNDQGNPDTAGQEPVDQVVPKSGHGGSINVCQLGDEGG